MKKVLVIEDNPDNLELISCALKRSGYEILAAISGEEGLEVAIRERPYFIIMDIDLPGMNGFETTKKIRSSSTSRDIPIIAVTSYAMRGDRKNIIDSGCTGYFEKPIDPLTIVDEIHKILQEAGT
ncbi:MAG: response regulator [Proteobacteria bacterium]|nr:response regulator [Pseudomonadota bacterium]MBU1737965.1 response regulator [Pseudomonadota bacterium]